MHTCMHACMHTSHTYMHALHIYIKTIIADMQIKLYFGMPHRKYGPEHDFSSWYRCQEHMLVVAASWAYTQGTDAHDTGMITVPYNDLSFMIPTMII